MASDAAPREFCYNVYIPSGPDARCYAFNMTEGAKVQDLEDAIRGRWSQKVKNEDIFLYKVKILSPTLENALSCCT